MGKGLNENIRRNMDSKSTEELIKIYREHNRNEWSDEAIDIVEKILVDRGYSVTSLVELRKAFVDKINSPVNIVNTALPEVKTNSTDNNQEQLDVISKLFLIVRKHIRFSGRMRRKDFWIFFSWYIGIYGVLILIENLMELRLRQLSEFYFFVTLIPIIAMTVRRLHDNNNSGWWLLFILFIMVLPVGCFIIFILWLLSTIIRDSQPGDNRYGPNPKGVMAQGGNSNKSSFPLTIGSVIGMFIGWSITLVLFAALLRPDNFEGTALPLWSFCGACIGAAAGYGSEVMLKRFNVKILRHIP